MTNAFASWIRSNGLTRHAVAVALGVGDSAVSKYCKPGWWPTLEVAQRLYRFTAGEVSPNDLFDTPERPERSAERELARQAIAEAKRKRERKNGKRKTRKSRITASREQRPE
jgi:transcriptional regulator with XRE-family HTH domain